MGAITYELNKEYYFVIKKFSKEVIKNSIDNNFVKDFQSFVKRYKLEPLRSIEEYYIEYLLIGLLWEEYIENAIYFSNKIKSHYYILNSVRNKLKNKEKIDRVRGIFNYKLIRKKTKNIKEYDYKDYKNLLLWLKASGDFYEEICRLENWRRFFEKQSDNYINLLIGSAIKEISIFNKRSDKVLGSFVENIDKYLINIEMEHKNKEDIIYCSKGKRQYYFNMFAADILNNLYRDRFLKSEEKLIFVPSCMRSIKNKCCSISSDMGFKCVGCSKECNVNKLTQIGKDNKFVVRIIPHESSLFVKEDIRNKNIGIIGIACVTNLLSGGWKAIRLGFNPQCVILNYSGCSKHWCKNPLMTEINIEEFNKVMNL